MKPSERSVISACSGLDERGPGPRSGSGFGPQRSSQPDRPDRHEDARDEDEQVHPRSSPRANTPTITFATKAIAVSQDTMSQAAGIRRGTKVDGEDTDRGEHRGAIEEPVARSVRQHLRPDLAHDLRLLEAAIAVRDVDRGLRRPDQHELGDRPQDSADAQARDHGDPPRIAVSESRAQRETESRDRDERHAEAEVAEQEDRPDRDPVVLDGKAHLDHVQRGREGRWRRVQVLHVDDPEGGPDQEQDADGPREPPDGLHPCTASSYGRTRATVTPASVANRPIAEASIDKSVVPKPGLEPTRGCPQRCLRPSRLPFRHFGPVAIVPPRRARPSRNSPGRPTTSGAGPDARLARLTIAVRRDPLTVEDLRSTTVPDDPVQRRDLILLERARDGDLDAFNDLVLLYQDQLFALVVRMVPDRDQASDASRRPSSRRSGTWRVPWRQRQVLAQPDLRQRGDGHPARPQAAAGPAVPRARGRELAAAGRRGRRSGRTAVLTERTRALRGALAAITDDQRAAIVLYDVEGYDYAEIAEMTGVSLGTVKSRIHRGRLALRDLLEGRMELFRG